MKIVYRTNDGVHEETLRNEFHSLTFENGVPADRERLKFYAQHCEGHLELTEQEFRSAMVPNIIEVRHGNTTK